MSTPQVDRYSTGTYTTAQGQEVPQFNVASGISLDAWRNAKEPQAPLQPPPPQPPPFAYRTYGGGMTPTTPNGQFPPQYNVGSQAGVDLYQSAHPSLTQRIDLNPHADWYGGMGGLYFSSGYPFPNPPAGYNIQEATALEIASMGGFEGLSALGGNVATNDQFLANMTQTYGQAFGGGQTDVPEVKIDLQQIAKWGWLVGMVLGGVPMSILKPANKDNTDPNDPQQETTNEVDLPSWAGTTLSNNKLYSILMESATNTNEYLGGFGNPPIYIRPQYTLPPDYYTSNLELTAMGKKFWLAPSGLTQKDIGEINKASQGLQKKSGAMGGGLTSADSDLLGTLQQLINNDNVQKQQVPPDQRGLISANNKKYSTGATGNLARATASPTWIKNFTDILTAELYADRNTNGTPYVWYKNYIGELPLSAGAEQPPDSVNAPLKVNYGSSSEVDPLAYVLNKGVYEEVINATPKITKEFKLDKIATDGKGVLLFNYLEQNKTTAPLLLKAINELKTLSTQQQVANKHNIGIAIADMNRRGLKLTATQVKQFKFPPAPIILGEVGTDIQNSLNKSYPQQIYYAYWVMNQASKFLTSRQTAKADIQTAKAKLETTEGSATAQKEKIALDKVLAGDDLAQKEKVALSQDKVVHDFGL